MKGFPIQFAVLLILLLYSISCGKKCREDIEFCPLPETGERYFSGYKEGSYWIYHNRDSTKRDSVYVENYILEHKEDDLVNCNEWDLQEMKIVSQYLSEKELFCSYGNPACDISYFNLMNTIFSISLYSSIENDSLYDIETSSRELIYIGSLDTFKEVIRYELDYHPQIFWFTPEIGLFQYTSFNSPDTLYLTKFYRA